jgi:phage tail sheath protein FI
MALTIGVNVVETDGKAAPALQAAATSVGAFVVRSERGVPGAVFRLSSPGQFRDRFGGPVAAAFGAFAVSGFFDNGGATAYVTRVLDAAAKAATLALGTDLTVNAGYRGKPDPGTWGNDIEVQVQPNPVINTSYDLIVRYRGAVVETWEKLTLNPPAAGPTRKDDKTINDPFTGSRYITVTVPSGAAANPAAINFTALANGTDDTLTGNALDTALAAAFKRFDTSDVQLVACPESTAAAVVSAGLTYCETRGDCMFIGATPPGVDAAAAKAYGQGFQGNKIYGALYYPWIQVLHPVTGDPTAIPATGHVMGVYARTDLQRGIWKAPAGNEARVLGALATETALSDVDHTDLVKNGSVNAVRFIPGAGIVIDSARTLSTNTLWLYVNVRLLFNFVKTSL